MADRAVSLSDAALTLLREQGGLATRAALLLVMTEHELRQALARGDLVRLSRGRYALPEVVPLLDADAEQRRREVAERGRRAAHELTASAVLLSAAAAWGWPTKWYPQRPQVAVPTGRKVTRDCRRRFDVRWRDVAEEDLVDGWVTGRLRTAVDCALLLPPDEALCVLDSVLREGVVTREDLALCLGELDPRHPGRRRALDLLDLADPGAANPFESVLRWIVRDLPGLSVQTQVPIDDDAGRVGVVDLADGELRIVIEAESYEFHGGREAFERDCVRYTRLTAADWLVLRFTWDQVMHRPEWVRERVQRAVALRLGEPAALGSDDMSRAA
ncbi:type IV toxin-antitoxin system AbiEi family antitoxin domain-containing protein [Marihabitans asiaticum]|uniref:Very-short-patch-repair endonuclease n=1 Tax=Marihabitans asiaticum TaxID=415218 RepID=A0A560WDR7_9MICO|nr:DUF559 domain-containing protein [Marihabitans asiaticum]TWD15811.1 very-short-patch-repair endonuclease [Marihabitans asiaticum]